MLYLVPSSSDIMAFGLYLFQNSYVGFLSSQHWAFFGSVLDKAESAVYFAPIAGVSSLLGTLGALFVSKLVPLVGLNGLLLLGGFSLLVSSICADRSYAISIQVRYQCSSIMDARYISLHVLLMNFMVLFQTYLQIYKAWF